MNPFEPGVTASPKVKDEDEKKSLKKARRANSKNGEGSVKTFANSAQINIPIEDQRNVFLLRLLRRLDVRSSDVFSSRGADPNAGDSSELLITTLLDAAESISYEEFFSGRVKAIDLESAVVAGSPLIDFSPEVKFKCSCTLTVCSIYFEYIIYWRYILIYIEC